MLLADVSYHAKHHDPLLDHVANCLSPGGVVLHSDPFRSASTRFLTELSSRLPTMQGEVVIRQGNDATSVRVVVASASSAALETWSRPLALPVLGELRQPLDVAARPRRQGDGLRPSSRSATGESERLHLGPALGSPVEPT
jgi:hypothetical protein